MTVSDLKSAAKLLTRYCVNKVRTLKWDIIWFIRPMVHGATQLLKVKVRDPYILTQACGHKIIFNFWTTNFELQLLEPNGYTVLHFIVLTIFKWHVIKPIAKQDFKVWYINSKCPYFCSAYFVSIYWSQDYCTPLVYMHYKSGGPWTKQNIYLTRLKGFSP